MKRTLVGSIARVFPFIVVAVIGVTWWLNGRDDTWLYVAAAGIVLTAQWTVKPVKDADVRK